MRTRRPEISRNASAQREVESAIILTLYPISLKYSAMVIPEENIMQQKSELVYQLAGITLLEVQSQLKQTTQSRVTCVN